MTTKANVSGSPARSWPAIAAVVTIAVAAFAIGMVVFVGIRLGIELLWVDVPSALPQWVRVVYVLVVPTAAGIAVAWMRQHEANGHSPLSGFAIEEVPVRTYPWLLGSVVATLFGGLVLGPEMALVLTGCFVGTAAVHRGMRIQLPLALKIGVGAAILVLFVEPILHGSFDVTTNYALQWSHVIGALVVGVLTGGALAAGRVASIWMLGLRRGDIPAILPMALTGFAVGLLAVIYHVSTGQDEIQVLTSGEGQVRQLAALGGVGLIAFTTLIKWVAYSLSMGGGFRGGPYFPAIFVGAGLGLIGVAISPTLFGAGPAVGIVAAVVYLAHPKIPAVIVLGVVLGFILGGLPLIVCTVLGALMARVVPLVRYDDSAEPHLTGEPVPHN